MKRVGWCAILVLLLCASLPSMTHAHAVPMRPAQAAPTATPVRTLPPGPLLSVVGVRILHLVRGKEVVTQHLVAGEFAEFLVQYRAVGVSHVTATVAISKNGTRLGSVLLAPLTYAGHPSLGWIFGFTRGAGTGTFYAHFHLSGTGGHIANRDQKFFVTLR